MKYGLSFLYFCIAMTCLTNLGLALDKSITRLEDPIIFQGDQLKDLMDSDPASLALMAYHNDRFSPIPFQIDQKHEDGSYAFTNGKDARPDSEPNLDANDELVFMINDLGDKAPLATLPQGAVRGMVLTVTDPVDNKQGWAYLFSFTGKPPRSGFSYICPEYNKEDGSFGVITRNIERKKSIFFRHPEGKLLVDEARRYFPDGELGEDFLDRVKIRTKMKFRFIPTINVPLDEWLKGKVTGWIEGPVRIISISDVFIKFVFMKFSTGGNIVETYYRNCLRSSLTMSSSITPESVVQQMPIMGYLDMNKHILNHKVYSKSLPPSSPIHLDNRISHDEEKINKDNDHSWITGYGPLGALVCRLYLPETGIGLYLNEDLEIPQKPEAEKGEIGVGWKMFPPENAEDSVMTRDDIINAGLNPDSVNIHIYILDQGFKPPMEIPILNIQDNPVKLSSSIYMDDITLIK